MSWSSLTHGNWWRSSYLWQRSEANTIVSYLFLCGIYIYSFMHSFIVAQCRRLLLPRTPVPFPATTPLCQHITAVLEVSPEFCIDCSQYTMAPLELNQRTQWTFTHTISNQSGISPPLLSSPQCQIFLNSHRVWWPVGLPCRIQQHFQSPCNFPF